MASQFSAFYPVRHLLMLSSFILGCHSAKRPEVRTPVYLQIALDGSRHLSDRRNAALQLQQKDLTQLRSRLLEHIFGKSVWITDNLHLLLNIGDEETAQSLEDKAKSDFLELDGKLRAEMFRVVAVIRQATARDPNQDVKLTKNELYDLESSGDLDELPAKNEWPQVLYKDKDGNVYVKADGVASRGFPTAYNVK